MKACAVSFWLLALAFLASACTNSTAVNAAFQRTRVSWFVFDPDRPDGLRNLAGFEQASKTTWVPRPKAVLATDVAGAGSGAAVAVSHLGLLILDDSGALQALRPAAQWPLVAYQTDRVFSWKGKVFVTLRQELPAEAPPASLAWWVAGQSRLVFYPIPSQVRDPSRQAVFVDPPAGDGSVVGFVWRRPEGNAWVDEAASLALDTGVENQDSGLPAMVARDAPPGPGYEALVARLAERLGAGIPVRVASGADSKLAYTATGWVAVGRSGGGPARLYHLPELGNAGRYTGAVSLTRGWVFTWEESFRAYAGAAGLVHVPFAVLEP